MTSRLVTCSLAAVLASAPASAGQAGERLTLSAAVGLAVEHNIQVQSALLQVDKADADLAIARTRRLPSLEAQVNASQLVTPASIAFPRGAFGEYPSVGPVPATDTTVSASRQPTAYVSTQITQPLTRQLQIGLGIRSAAVTRAIEAEHVRAQRLAVVASVKQGYFAILQTESALAATREAVALYRELDRTLQARVAQQVALRSDALDVQVRLAQAELTRTTHEHTLASQKEHLNHLLGRGIDTPFEVDEMAPLTPLDLDVAAARATALVSRPDVREARLALERAELDGRIARADRLPDVSLALSYASYVNVDVLPSNLATVGVQVKWEPFDWGRRTRTLAIKAHTVSQARLAVRDAEDRTALEINSRARTLEEMRARLLVAQLSQRTAREKLRVATNQFQVQAVQLPDVLQRRAELAASDDEYQRALLDFWTARANVEQAIGEEVRP